MGNETSKGGEQSAAQQEATRAFTHVLREANITGPDWDDLEDTYHDHVWTGKGADGTMTTSDAIAAEFEMLQRREGMRSDAAVAENCFSHSKANQDKNRYKNVIPFDATRVPLRVHKPLEGETWDSPHRRNVSYINANWVNLDASLKEITEPYDDCDFRPSKKGKTQLPGVRPDEKKSSLRFIACQAPTKSTIEDFMRMTWEHDCRVIVMLTRLNEGIPARAKADLYWEAEEDASDTSSEDHDTAFWATDKGADANAVADADAEGNDAAKSDDESSSSSKSDKDELTTKSDKEESTVKSDKEEPTAKSDKEESTAKSDKEESTTKSVKEKSSDGPKKPAWKAGRPRASSKSKRGSTSSPRAKRNKKVEKTTDTDKDIADADSDKRKTKVVPGKHEPYVAGDFSMEVVQEEERCDGAYIVRTIKLRLSGPLAARIVNGRSGAQGKKRIHSVSRTIKQFHFVSWPDHGVPNQTAPLLQMMNEVNEAARDSEEASKSRLEGTGKKKKPKPVIVHCSAGIGRTGTFILIDTVQKALTSAFKKNPDVPPVINLMQLVDQMRSMRTGMLTAPEQYEFCYKTIYDHLCRLNNE